MASSPFVHTDWTPLLQASRSMRPGRRGAICLALMINNSAACGLVSTASLLADSGQNYYHVQQKPSFPSSYVLNDSTLAKYTYILLGLPTAFDFGDRFVGDPGYPPWIDRPLWAEPRYSTTRTQCKLLLEDDVRFDKSFPEVSRYVAKKEKKNQEYNYVEPALCCH